VVDGFIPLGLSKRLGLVCWKQYGGLPVITTPNTGGPDVIEEEKEGFIVPAGSVGALREKMEWLIQNPSRAVEMGRQAHARASHFTWETYEQRYREEILG
jgi:glycosyltransferase involved in cell wall biosynthesis